MDLRAENVAVKDSWVGVNGGSWLGVIVVTVIGGVIVVSLIGFD